MIETFIVSAFVLGLMGSLHCIGMCGGIITSLSMATTDSPSKWLKTLNFQVGRIASYSMFGFCAGWVGLQVKEFSAIPILKIISSILLILMGLYLAKWWMGLRYLEKIGSLLWQKISPLSKKLLPVASQKQALLLGALWGWLPCGLVYTSLSYALTTANPLHSSLYMLYFGLGTLPGTLLVGTASITFKRWINLPLVRGVVALFFILAGLVSLWLLIFPEFTSTHHH